MNSTSGFPRFSLPWLWRSCSIVFQSNVKPTTIGSRTIVLMEDKSNRRAGQTWQESHRLLFCSFCIVLSGLLRTSKTLEPLAPSPLPHSSRLPFARKAYIPTCHVLLYENGSANSTTNHKWPISSPTRPAATKSEETRTDTWRNASPSRQYPGTNWWVLNNVSLLRLFSDEQNNRSYSCSIAKTTFPTSAN